MRANAESRAAATLTCLMVFAVVFIIYTTQYLPETVATHFGIDRRADGWMSRNGYLLFMLSFTIGISSFVALAVGTFPRKFPLWTNLPNRDYWLAPPRGEESLVFLSAHGKRLGCLVVLLMVGVHYSILVAHRTQPPTLPLSDFTAIMISFVLALMWWLVRLYRRFPKPKD